MQRVQKGPVEERGKTHITGREEGVPDCIEGETLFFMAMDAIREKDPEKKAEYLKKVQYLADRFPGDAKLVKRAAKDAVIAERDGEIPLPEDAPEEKRRARKLREYLEVDDPDQAKAIAAFCDDGTYDTMPAELLREGQKEYWDTGWDYEPDLPEEDTDSGQNAGQQTALTEQEMETAKLLMGFTPLFLDTSLRKNLLSAVYGYLEDLTHDNRKRAPRAWEKKLALLDEAGMRELAAPQDIENLLSYLQSCPPRILTIYYRILAELVPEEALAEKIREMFPVPKSKNYAKEEEEIVYYESPKAYIELMDRKEREEKLRNDFDGLFAEAEAHRLTLKEHFQFGTIMKRLIGIRQELNHRIDAYMKEDTE